MRDLNFYLKDHLHNDQSKFALRPYQSGLDLLLMVGEGLS